MGMLLLLVGNVWGLFSLFVAAWCQHRAVKGREPAHMIMAIKRASYVVSRTADETISQDEVVEMFHREVEEEFVRRKIPFAREKAKAMAKTFKKDQF